MTKLEALERYGTISFDIFDTLITRKFIQPKDLFYAMESQLLEKFDSFAEHRIKAELECRRQYDFNQEVSLEEIYDYLLKKRYIPNMREEDVNFLIDMELELEKNNIYVNPEIKSVITKLINKSKQVIYISDTYMPKKFILHLFEKFNIPFEYDNVFISSEIGLMKSNKKLFQYVIDRLGIKPKDLCHIGDNEISDVINPKSLGIEAIHYTRAIANRYEKQNRFKNIRLSRMRALSKKIRLDNPYQHDKHKATIWNTTADVSAPLMTGFTIWCLQKADELGIKRIYFCSRDGQIIYKIAKKLLPTLNLSLKLNYLYVSRQSLLFPSIKEVNDEALEWIMAPTAILTPNIILKRINTKPEEIYHLLKNYGFYSKLNKHLSETERLAFRNMLKEMAPLIISKAHRYRINALGYLKQQGLHKDRFVLVDIGWSGTLQRSISRILDEEGYRIPTYGLYFGLKRRKKYKDEDQLHAWFTDHRNPRELDKKTYIIPMTELFTSALHGGVQSYLQKNGSYTPKLMKENNEHGLQWGVDIQHEAMLAYANELTKIPHLSQDLALNQELDYLERNYEKFLLHPSYNEAKVYGAYKDAEDQNESYHIELAKPFNWMERLKIFINKDYKHHHNEWKEGAMKLTQGEKK